MPPPPTVRYTNVRVLSSPAPSASPMRQSAPYVSRGNAGQVMPLTAREREARRLQRVGNSGFGARTADGFSIDPVGGRNTNVSGAGSFFSPQMSTDFLELPQSLREKREIYRHFYNSDPIVGQAIDLHTELPLSKIRLGSPKPRTCPKGFKSPEDYGAYILSFYTKMCKRIKLFHRLVTAVHHYNLDGTAFIFAEDSEVQVPAEVGHDKQVEIRSTLMDDGEAREDSEEVWVTKDNREDEEFAYYQKHYHGWQRIIIFPIDQVKVTTFSYTDKMRIELIPADRDKQLVEQAKQGDPVAEEMTNEIPAEVRDHIENGRLIPLGTDPDEGSFVYALCGRKGAGEEMGQSILDRCHIAGTPVLVKRNGVVQQVPIEDLDPDTDWVLSHTGMWREFEVGTRPVSENVSLLHVAKMEPPIGCTRDHKYPVLRAGQLIETVAGDIRPGDYLRVAQIPLSESALRNVDIAYFMDGLEGGYKTLKSGNESTLHLEVVDRTQDTFTVKYKKEQTDPRKIGRTNDVNAILEWASTLTEPVAMRSAEVCDRFGLHPVTLREIRTQLVSFGYGVTLTKGKTVIFPPNPTGIRMSTGADFSKTFPRWLELNADLGYFLGFWLGDGHIAKQSALEYGTLGFSYGPNEPASVVSIEQKIKPMLDKLKVGWSDSKAGAGQLISGCQDALVRWMAVNFGHVCEDKHLPEWIFDAPKDFLLGLLRGFVDSDGDVVRKKDGSVSVKFNGTNALLMDQVFLLCTSLGIPASKTKPAKERWVKQTNGQLAWAKPAHFVHFTHGPSVKAFFESGFLAKRQDPDVWKDGRSGSRHVEHDGKLYYRVQKVETALHTGPVYSLNVHVDHTFYTSSVSTCNCLRILYYKEKLRQAQTQIADRAMTPRRIVWAEDISDSDAEDLREQVDLALVDPDYSIVTNYEVHWEEMSSKDRLLDLSTEYEILDKQLLTGLGVTESLMSGESLYSGDRLKLEVINTRYLYLRDVLQEYVEENLFKPVARRKGFIEQDEWGEESVIFPTLSFTRLPLRDSQDTFDALLNLYQKGSLSIDVILELFNIDPHDTRVKIEKDMWTVNDATFNEVVRGVYSSAAQKIVDTSNIADKLTKYMGLQPAPPEGGAEPSRFE